MLVLNIVFVVRFFFLGWLVLMPPKRAEAVQLLEEMGKGPLGQAGAGLVRGSQARCSQHLQGSWIWPAPRPFRDPLAMQTLQASRAAAGPSAAPCRAPLHAWCSSVAIVISVYFLQGHEALLGWAKSG